MNPTISEIISAIQGMSDGDRITVGRALADSFVRPYAAKNVATYIISRAWQTRGVIVTREGEEAA